MSTEQDNIREKLADHQHQIWLHWMRYQFECCIENQDGSVTIPYEKVQHWKRQMETPYGKLSEQEKESDRQEADKIIRLL